MSSTDIGPRLPQFDGENCDCGGILVLTSKLYGQTIWQCGQCSKVIKFGEKKLPDKTE